MKKIIFVLLLLVACMGPIQKKVPQSYEVMTGTSALEVSFNPNSMRELLMCQQANVLVDMKNTGTLDIEGGLWSFILEEQTLQPIKEKQKSFDLEGKSQFNPRGGVAQFEFKVQNVGLPEQLESYDSPLILQACYTYKTSAGVQVCVDPDTKNVNSQKPCRAEPVSLSGGQGAPVAITRVEPLMVPVGNKVSPKFAVYAQHVGLGTIVTEEGAELACTGGEESKARLSSYATVKADLQGRPLSCTPNPVRFEAGKEVRFICDNEEAKFGSAEGTFTSILNVELSYGYVNTAVLPMKITRLAGQKACK